MNKPDAGMVNTCLQLAKIVFLQQIYWVQVHVQASDLPKLRLCLDQGLGDLWREKQSKAKERKEIKSEPFIKIFLYYSFFSAKSLIHRISGYVFEIGDGDGEYTF